MNYIQKSYEEIFESMLNDSLEKGLISHASEFASYIANKEDISNYYVMDKSVIAEMFSKVYEDLTNVYNSINLELATGVDLDNIGNIVGIIRPSATYAMVELVFSCEATDSDVTVTDEVIVSSSNGISYRTLEEIYIPAGETEVKVQAIASLPGVRSKVGENVLTIISSEIPAGVTLAVTNPKGSNGGREEYSDEEYRELLMSWSLIYLKGSLEAYENYFANFDGIDGYKLVPNWDGSGTMKVILDPGTSYQLNQAYNELQSSVVQATEAIVMTSPEAIPINVYAVVNVDIDQINPYSDIEKDTIKSKMVAAIKVFIDGGYRVNGDYYPGLVIGEDFIPHKLAVFLDDEIFELKSITFNYPEDYVQISDDEIGVSDTITIEMI